MATNNEPLYSELVSETENSGLVEVESLCMKCNEQGITKLLLTKIPHYKEIIITSFECSDCGEKNNGIQSSSIQELGIIYELQVKTNTDLSRQIVKSDNATLTIPELEFEIPADGQRGDITTVEGVIVKAVEGLSQDQEARKSLNMELFEKIQSFINKLEALIKLDNSFTLVIDDPTGNSFIENVKTPAIDPQLTVKSYQRSKLQNQNLGYYEEENGDVSPSENLTSIAEDEEDPIEKSLKEEVLQFNTICDQCSRPSITKMKVVQIPHFKEVVIMASECDACGHKSNEVKSGGGIEKKGKKFTLHIKNIEDIARDILKSETCSVSIPEFDLYAGAGIFVGKFTTVEGLLTDIKDDMLKNPFLLGDSTTDDKKQRMKELMQDLEKVIEGRSHIHLILDDPAGNSFVQDLFTPEEDPYLLVEEYERSYEQAEDLGLNDMKTENYSENDA